MAETAVSLAPKIWETIKMLRDLPEQVLETRDELESFQDFINDADHLADAENDDANSKRGRMKTTLMRLRKTAFEMEDIIDEYDICEGSQPDDLGCAALPCEALHYIKALIPRLQIAYQIREVRSLVAAKRDEFQRNFPSESRPSSSGGNQNVPWHKLRMDPLFIKEDEVVGLDRPTHILKNLLIEGRQERTVISVVGIPGIGKTTLAKRVFDKVHNNFECHALIIVSKSYTVEGLLRDILNRLCKEKMEDTPKNVSTMDRRSLTEEVRECLRNKRYVVLFDDVWNEKFWDDIESALIDDKNKSRILITTRYDSVASFCKKSSLVQVHRLEEPLSAEESFRLFCRSAFKYGFNGRCPDELEEISLEIVRQCNGLPLAIMAVGGLLSQKDESAPEWRLFSQNLSLELQRNSELSSVAKILSLSYDDLPHNLRSCLLYFGMYPEDYQVKSDRLIRQWVAEGFVKYQSGKTLEEIAQQHLIELINRSLVQVSSFTIDGRVKRCLVHDSIREMILGKINDTGYSQDINEHDQCMASATVRRLKITTCSENLIGSIERSHIRSVLFFSQNRLYETFISKILAKYMPLKVLDFENEALRDVPENVCNFIQLKYLSFRNTRIRSLPKSIGKLQNLETLDVRRTRVSDIPKEICKLRKLRHLLAGEISSVSVKDSLGGMASLQKIRLLKIDDGGVVIRELGKLTQLRDLRISDLRRIHGEILHTSINQMRLLDKLHIYGYPGEVIDLDFLSSNYLLRRLSLSGEVNEWPIRSPFLTTLSLNGTMLTKDSLESLKKIPNLLFLSFTVNAYAGETLHFQNRWFRRLKELELSLLENLNSIIIDIGALCSLQMFAMSGMPQLKTVPSGIQHLQNLQVLKFWAMPTAFLRSIAPDGGQDHWMIKHVHHVRHNV